MKISGIIIVVVLLIGAGILLFSPKAPSDVQSLQVDENTSNIENENTNQEGEDIDIEGKVEITDFSFVGYGPGKTHIGEFEEYEIRNVKVNEAGIPVAGEIVIKTASITTDTEMLTDHLKENENFFDVTKYPEIKFALANTTEASENLYTVTGDLTIKGVTKRVAFTVNGNEDKTFTSEFKLNMTDFEFSAPGIVDEEVLIKFAGKVN